MSKADEITNLNKSSIVIKAYNIERWCWTHG